MENSLNTYLNDQILPVALSVYYHIGNEFQGATDFHLRGDGAYQLWSTVTQDRQRRNYSGQLKITDVQELVRVMRSVQLWTVKHIFTERGRDNSEVRIVVTAGEESFTVVLWVMEIEEVPAFDKVQEEILILIRRISGGEVLEAGR